MATAAAASPTATTSSTEEGLVVTILVTGFGPFSNETVSPSYMIATTLPASLPPSPTCPFTTRIIFYPYQIPVSYEEVRYLVPRLYQAYNGSVDVILHMGTTSTRNYYAIERLGHRDNYDAFEDTYGAKLDRRDGLTFWHDCPPILETSLDFDDVFQRWRSNLLGASQRSSALLNGLILRPSQDPGHFVCDFMYYSSLAEHWRQKRDNTRPGSVGNNFDHNNVDERPVMFLHIPGWTGADDLRRGKAVTIGLLRALAHSWITTKRRAGSQIARV